VIVDSRELTKMVHVVHDIETAVERFSTLFGLDSPEITSTTAPDGTDPRVYTWYRGRHIGGLVKVASLQMGPVQMEFIEPVDADSPWAEFQRNHGDGIFSIVFTVNDFDAHIKRLEAEGMPIYHRGEYGTGRYAYFESKDQLGVTLCVQQIDD
jgi:methylmalonyl-CoA/ethylmalonyl-CoA epimerase